MENIRLAKAFLDNNQFEDQVTLSDLKRIRRFVKQVKGSLPFLPQCPDLVSPTDRMLNILSCRIKREIARRNREVSRLSPKVVLVFSVYNLNAFLQARLEIFRKYNLRNSGVVTPIEGILSIPDQKIHKVLPVGGKLLQQLREIVFLTQSVLHGSAFGKSKVQVSKIGNSMVCLNREIEPTASQVIIFIENMEEFAKLVNKTWLATR